MTGTDDYWKMLTRNVWEWHCMSDYLWLASVGLSPWAANSVPTNRVVRLSIRRADMQTSWRWVERNPRTALHRYYWRQLSTDIAIEVVLEALQYMQFTERRLFESSRSSSLFRYWMREVVVRQTWRETPFRLRTVSALGRQTHALPYDGH